VPSRALLLLASLALGRVAFGFQIQTVATLTPILVQRFGIDYASLGTLIGLYMLPGLFAALPVGLLARRYGDRLVVGLGLLLMTAGPCLGDLAGGVWGIGAGRLVAGLGAVTVVVLQSKILADWFSPRTFLPALAVSTASYPVGVGLSQLVQPWLAAHVGWQVALGSGAAVAALAGLLFVAAHPPAEAGRRPSGFGLPDRRECGLITLAGLMWTTYNAAYVGFLSYVPALLVERHETGHAGLVMTVATWSNVPAMIFGSTLAVRLGRVPVLTLAATMLALSTAAVTQGPILLWAAVFGVLGALHPSIIIAAGTEAARPEHRSVGMGLFFSTYYLGGAVMPGLFGRVGDAVGSASGALLAAAAVSVLCLPLFFLHRRLARRQLPLGVALRS
jgi:predicted MFS family arabinose efflux permease